MSAAVMEKPEPRMIDVAKLDGKEKVSIDVITPSVAKRYLDEYNEDNFRRMMPASVRKYKRAIEEGKFPLSNSMIILCTDRATGRVMLGDGQHRLQACVDAGLPIRQVVLRGADPAIIIHADRGKNRQFSDYLAWMGYGHSKVLSMALKVFHTYKNNVDRIVRPGATDDELYDLVRNRPDVVLSVEWACEYSLGTRPDIRMTSSWLAVARALILEVAALPGCKDPEQARTDADQFFTWLISGDRTQMASDLHPVAQLLDTLRDHGCRARDTDKFEPWRLLAYVLKAWNRYRAGDFGSVLSVRLGGKNPEPFPEPK